MERRGDQVEIREGARRHARRVPVVARSSTAWIGLSAHARARRAVRATSREAPEPLNGGGDAGGRGTPGPTPCTPRVKETPAHRRHHDAQNEALETGSTRIIDENLGTGRSSSASPSRSSSRFGVLYNAARHDAVRARPRAGERCACSASAGGEVGMPCCWASSLLLTLLVATPARPAARARPRGGRSRRGAGLRAPTSSDCRSSMSGSMTLALAVADRRCCRVGPSRAGPPGAASIDIDIIEVLKSRD